MTSVLCLEIYILSPLASDWGPQYYVTSQFNVPYSNIICRFLNKKYGIPWIGLAYDNLFRLCVSLAYKIQGLWVWVLFARPKYYKSKSLLVSDTKRFSVSSKIYILPPEKHNNLKCWRCNRFKDDCSLYLLQQLQLFRSWIVEL